MALKTETTQRCTTYGPLFDARRIQAYKGQGCSQRIKVKAYLLSSPTRSLLSSREESVGEVIVLVHAIDQSIVAAEKRRAMTNDKMARRVLKPQEGSGKISIDCHQSEVQEQEVAWRR